MKHNIVKISRQAGAVGRTLVGGGALLPAATLGVLGMAITLTASAQPLPGGTLDPTTIPKYVTPLVIPPVMNNTGTANDYDIAVRQFQQQILPGGIWATLPGCTGANCTFPPTTVWSYGPDADPTPAVAPDPASQFNYPAYTLENTAGTRPRWTGSTNWWSIPWLARRARHRPPIRRVTIISHLLPIDRTLHWANPEQLPCMDPTKTKDCRPDPANGAILQQPYLGPVPIITHVHGAHVGPESDGYPEAWYLPDANNIPAGYATQGTLVNQYGAPTNTGPAWPVQLPEQPAVHHLWYHDHSLGMTRNNVYAGPAGFWLVREPGRMARPAWYPEHCRVRRRLQVRPCWI